MQKVIRGEPCPNCGICIIKTSGCNHMVCSKCNYEFCWACLGHYPGYIHTESTFCPIRHVLLYYFVFYFLILSVNEKLRFQFPTFRSIEDDILDWFMFILASNCYAALIMLWFSAIGEMNYNSNLMNLYPEYSESYNIFALKLYYKIFLYTYIYRRGYRISLAVVILFPIFYIGFSVFLYIVSDYFRSMLLCLLFECCIAIVVIIVSIIVVVFNWCRRDRNSYQSYNDPYNEYLQSIPDEDANDRNLFTSANIPQEIRTPLLVEEESKHVLRHVDDIEMASYRQPLNYDTDQIKFPNNKYIE